MAQSPHPSQTVITVAPQEAGQRLDRVAAVHFPELSRANLKRAMAQGTLTLNGRRPAKGMHVAAGDTITLRGPTDVTVLPAHGAPLSVLHEDQHMLVVDKPAGQPCHPLHPGEQDTLVSTLLAHYPELAQLGGDPREPGLVHRLDTDTSGLLLVARTRVALETLRSMLRAGQIDKTYVAACASSQSPPPLGNYPAILVANRGAKVRVLVSPSEQESQAGRAIVTELLHVTPVTNGWRRFRVRIHRAGRHQVRAHLAALGHPLVGDRLYGGLETNTGHLLHADTVTLKPPWTDAPLMVASAPPCWDSRIGT